MAKSSLGAWASKAAGRSEGAEKAAQFRAAGERKVAAAFAASEKARQATSSKAASAHKDAEEAHHIVAAHYRTDPPAVGNKDKALSLRLEGRHNQLALEHRIASQTPALPRSNFAGSGRGQLPQGIREIASAAATAAEKASSAAKSPADHIAAAALHERAAETHQTFNRSRVEEHTERAKEHRAAAAKGEAGGDDHPRDEQGRFSSK